VLGLGRGVVELSNVETLKLFPPRSESQLDSLTAKLSKLGGRLLQS
jgi:hypothetical protein